MKRILLITLILFSISLASTLNVAVSANVSYAIDELKSEFIKQHSDAKLSIIIGSSAKLASQIMHGAPYDIYMSANMDYPHKLYTQKLALDKPVVYAKGLLIYFSTKPQDYSKGMQLLQQDSLSKIAIANPKTAPYGKIARDALQNAGVYESVKQKLVYGESIAQTFSYALRAVDIALLSKSVLSSKQLQGYLQGIHYEDVSRSLYEPIPQGIVILKRAKYNDDAKDFYSFVLSTKGQKILKRYGYLVHE